MVAPGCERGESSQLGITPQANASEAAPASVATLALASAWPDDVVAAEMTREHNQARAGVVTDAALPPVQWSPALARAARSWARELAQRCGVLEHRTEPSYGQNLAARASTGVDTRFSAAEAVAGWMAEGQCYTRGKFGTTDRCEPDCVAKLRSTGCGHYTQVVWRATRQVGCGYSSCNREGSRVEFWVCNYSPPGNVQGREPY